jgi:hypothetical protein
VSHDPTTPAGTAPGGQTLDAPDVDQPDGGGGQDGTTPDAPDVDQPEGGADA